MFVWLNCNRWWHCDFLSEEVLQTNKQTNKQTSNQTNKQATKQTNKQNEKKTNKQTNIYSIRFETLFWNEFNKTKHGKRWSTSNFILLQQWQSKQKKEKICLISSTIHTTLYISLSHIMQFCLQSQTSHLYQSKIILCIRPSQRQHHWSEIIYKYDLEIDWRKQAHVVYPMRENR